MLSFKNLDALVRREHQKQQSGSREDLMDDELRKAARDTKKQIERAFDTKIRKPLAVKMTSGA